MCPIYHPGRPKKRVGERLRFVTFRVKCFLWVDKPGSGAREGFGFASDLSEGGAGVYVDAKIPKGTFVRLAFEDESTASYRGMVAWCQRYSLTRRFHGQAALDHRIGVQLLFESEAERQRYLMAYNDLRKRAAALTGEYKF
jgi:hypothetical protein